MLHRPKTHRRRIIGLANAKALYFVDGQANSLIVKLENAIKNLDKGKAKTALNNLNAFMNEVQSLVDEGVLTPEEGQSLIDAAVAISHQIQVQYQLP